jgi:glyoxylate/hydroxypyruvate/2-ketogluconate reductase
VEWRGVDPAVCFDHLDLVPLNTLEGFAMTRPQVLVARAVFPEVVARLRQHFEVQENASDDVFTPAQLIQHLQGKQGAFTTGSERIGAEVLAACPDLRVVAIIKAKPKSAVVSVNTSGVLVHNTPRAVQAGTSKLL